MNSPQRITADTWTALKWEDMILLYQEPTEEAFDDFWAREMSGESLADWTMSYVGREWDTDRGVWELSKLDNAALLPNRAESSTVFVCEPADARASTQVQQSAPTASPLFVAVQTRAA